MKIDWITITIIIVMIGCIFFFVSYYYLNQVNVCAANPLVYSANYYSELYPDSQVVGNLYILQGASRIIVQFNSTGMVVVP